MNDQGSFNVGDRVRLSKEALKIRVTEMKSWYGIVVSEVLYSMKGSDDVIVRNKIDWGKHREDKPAFVWEESPEFLVLS
jgi:hypothetical protein